MYFMKHGFVVLMDTVLDADLYGLRQAAADLIEAAEAWLPALKALWINYTADLRFLSLQTTQVRTQAFG